MLSAINYFYVFFKYSIILRSYTITIIVKFVYIERINSFYKRIASIYYCVDTSTSRL